jgi:hypothetical protein
MNNATISTESPKTGGLDAVKRTMGELDWRRYVIYIGFVVVFIFFARRYRFTALGILSVHRSRAGSGMWPSKISLPALYAGGS